MHLITFNSVIRNLVLRLPCCSIYGWATKAFNSVIRNLVLRPFYAQKRHDEHAKPFNSVIRNLVLRPPPAHTRARWDRASLSIPLYGIWSWDILVTRKTNPSLRLFQFRYTEFGLETFLLSAYVAQWLFTFNSVIRNLVLRLVSTRSHALMVRSFQFRYTEFGLETMPCIIRTYARDWTFNSVIRNLVLRLNPERHARDPFHWLSIPLYGIWSWDFTSPSSEFLALFPFNSVIRNLVLRPNTRASIPRNRWSLSIPLYGIWSWDLSLVLARC